jgi:hypothetical protein
VKRDAQQEDRIVNPLDPGVDSNILDGNTRRELERRITPIPSDQNHNFAT